jgi:hypothetical protein
MPFETTPQLWNIHLLIYLFFDDADRFFGALVDGFFDFVPVLFGDRIQQYRRVRLWTQAEYVWRDALANPAAQAGIGVNKYFHGSPLNGEIKMLGREALFVEPFWSSSHNGYYTVYSPWPELF